MGSYGYSWGMEILGYSAGGGDGVTEKSHNNVPHPELMAAFALFNLLNGMLHKLKHPDGSLSIANQSLFSFALLCFHSSAGLDLLLAIFNLRQGHINLYVRFPYF
ncbi:OLC1v1025132C1 [Oldenlandia corymbosa var. corymbosa]|uniref:OLC1v1025132C1 n=1 Tax=Oldenlandia corymbosa var. corymbosa TaxID=529605 RepID=A0AAV1C6T9_OLDCO|nr:OLC1v1025132C1 [Oldenlandia corymbosa var. corymbosa]